METARVQLDEDNNPFLPCADCGTRVALTKDEASDPELIAVHCQSCNSYGGLPRKRYHRLGIEYDLIACINCNEPVEVNITRYSPIAAMCSNCLAGKGLHKETIFNKTNGVCAYCGKPLNPFKFHKEHVIPQSKGGPTIPSNIVASCRKCNHKKKSKTLAEFREWLRLGGFVANVTTRYLDNLKDFHDWIKPMIETSDWELIDSVLAQAQESITSYFKILEKSRVVFELDKHDIELFLDGDPENN